MSKGLEALCYLDDIAHGRKMKLDPHELKLIVEKELKALEIIKKKHINVGLFLVYFRKATYEDYLNNPFEFKCSVSDTALTEDEFDLLKKVLC